LLSRPVANPPDDITQAANFAVLNTSIDCEAPTESEVSKALNKQRNDKAPGICGISGELLKYGSPAVVSWLTQIFKGIWMSGCVSDDWRKEIILLFYKGKGSRQECKNYRGITLLSCPGIVFAHLIIDQVKDKLLSV